MDIEAQTPLPLRVLSSSSGTVPTGPIDILSLLDFRGQPDKLVIQNAQGCVAFLFMMPMKDLVSFDESWQTDKAAAYLGEILGRKRIKPVSLSIAGLPTPKSELKTPSLAVLLPFDAVTADSIPLSSAEREDIAVAKELHRYKKSYWVSFIPRNPVAWFAVRFITTAIMLIAVLYLMQTVLFAEEKPWIRYDTSGSLGPRYQLQFSHRNVSDWAKSHSHEPGQWFLRIDDQAMIPSELVDDEELQYQKWYQDRYPEMNTIRINEMYLSEAFLKDPYAIQVPADRAFHMSHCVRAVRRYWQARETGHHICPRDIDYKHMKHCLDALDEWAFPDGPRGSVGGMQHSGHQKRHTDDGQAAIDHEDHTYLIWKTKVCFN